MSKPPKSYNPALASKDIAFQKWYMQNTLEGQAGIPYTDKQPYDYFSFYKDKGVGNIEGHFPDTYKRPSHPTFSNESIYSTPENPGGSWEGENYIPYNTMKKSKKLPKYPNGGFLQGLGSLINGDKDVLKQTGKVAGEIGSNMLRATGDTALTSVGLGNVIQDSDYSGAGSKFGRGYANIAGGVGQAALPIAANLLLPGSGQFVSMGQQAAGQFNPQAEGTSQSAQAMQMANPILNMGSQIAGQMLPYGGKIGAPNAELEKQENTLNPDGSTTQFNGPSHAQGGIPTQLDPNTLVFSDRLKIGKKTIADLNKPYNTKKEQKILDDVKATSIAKATADLMVKAKNRKSLELYQAQENMKYEKINKYATKMAYGGKIPKYTLGGEPDPLAQYTAGFDPKYANAMTNAGFLPIDSDAVSNSFNDLIMSDPANSAMAHNLSRNSASRGLTPAPAPQQAGSNIPWGTVGQVGMGLLQNAGNIYDLARARKVDNETYGRVNPTLLDPSQAIRDNNQTYTQANVNAREASVGNSSTYLNANRANAAQRMMANARIRKDFENTNAGITNQSKYYNNDISRAETIANLQNQAQSRNIRSNAISNMGQNVYGQVAGNQRDNAMTQRDIDYITMIGKSNPEVLRDPEMKKWYEERTKRR